MSVETDLKVLRSFVQREVAANDRYLSDGTSLFFGSTVPRVAAPTPLSNTYPGLGGREVARWSDHCRFHGLDGPEHARICPLANPKIILRRINNVQAHTQPHDHSDFGFILGNNDFGPPLANPTVVVQKPINNSVVLLCVPPPFGLVPSNIEVLVAQRVTPPRQREMEL